MSEHDGEDKRHDASPRKLQRARDKGEVAQSRDLNSAVVGLAVVAALWAFGGDLGARIEAVLRQAVVSAVEPQAGADRLAAAAALLGDGLEILLPLLVVPLAVGLLVAVAQVGPLFTLAPMQFKPERLDPVAGLKRKLLSAQAWVDLLLALLKMAAVGAVAWAVVCASTSALLGSMRGDARSGVGVLIDAGLRLGLFAGLALVGLGFADLAYRRFEFRRRQRMTDREARDDHRESEGAPELRQARRERHREIAESNQLARVRDADVVPVNPTHVACALRFDPRLDSAPRVLAKGRGALAAKIRAEAKLWKVPIRRDVPLARSIYSQVELGDEIPPELWDAAAELLRWVEAEQARKKRKARWR